MQTDQPLAQHMARTICDFADRLWIWQDRRRSRRALMRLPERALNDMGLGRSQAVAEYDKPFWRE
ncbi:MAG: DUF1127 domain-containing protein [Rhodospirillaceae bacterium]|jgi:uncharacterized protein YjiS (DUF1127 family)|nr:DUF1127 domain-containing protein [Rhodospirillaceae bacterium]MBT5459308.1 DUF1127 domain-containing protein [Rhodospirillaceae bacterium]